MREQARQSSISAMIGHTEGVARPVSERGATLIHGFSTENRRKFDAVGEEIGIEGAFPAWPSAKAGDFGRK